MNNIPTVVTQKTRCCYKQRRFFVGELCFKVQRHTKESLDYQKPIHVFNYSF